MKPFHALAFAALTLGTAACNEGAVNGTVPPIAGVVGGPDAQEGNGTVASEIETDGEHADPSEPVTVENLSREVEPGTAEILGPHTLVLVKGDVGDTLRVTLKHPTEGEVSRNFEVGSPDINEVRDPDGPEQVIHANQPAIITGSGFCISLGCNTVIFDGNLIATVEEPRPGLLYFNVPPGTSVGNHTVRVAVAGTEGGVAEYLSNEFTVELVP